MRKKCHIVLVTALVSFVLSCFSCSPDVSSEKKDIAIQVNESKITLEEFNDLIKFEAYVDPQLELTEENRDKFIEYLIRKEILIQEASRLRLERDKKFIKTIEQYWESTLIRNLLDLKSIEFKKLVLITDDEIEKYYVKNLQASGQSLDEAKKDIKQILESKAMEAKLEAWTANIKASADIIVNKALIHGE